MSDIWSGIGVDIAKSEGEWLFRKGGEVHGPVPKTQIINKLLIGEIDVETPVAREGGDFHPLLRVAAFSSHIQQAKKLESKRKAKKTRNVFIAIGVLLLIGGGAGGLYVFKEARRHADEQRIQAEKERLEHEAMAARVKAISESIDVIELVSLGSEDEVQVGPKRPAPGHKKKKKKKGGRGPAGPTGETGTDEFVSSCTRTRRDILTTLGRHVGKLNVCVLDEKKRDKHDLLPSTLVIEFVVKPEGKVTDFGITDRHYRSGILRNCMFKVFTMVRYPSAKGTNCPVTLPLKIGS